MHPSIRGRCRFRKSYAAQHMVTEMGKPHMKKNPALVDVNKLNTLVAALDLGDEKLNEYLNARWLNYVEWWDWRSRQAKRKYEALRCAVVVGSALIPALVGIRELKQFGEYSWIFAVALIAVSLVVAICGGIEGLFGFGDIWREKRMAAELIKSEGFSFFELTGAYAQFKTHQQAYKLFAQNVEDLIRHEIRDYVVAVTPKATSEKSNATSGATGGV